MSNIVNVVLILSVVSLNTVGQILIKKASGRIDFNAGILNILFQSMTSPFIISGVSCYVLGLATWVFVLSKNELSFAYPLMSLTYIFVTIAGIYVFQEQVTLLRWVGIAFILLGVFIISRS